MADAFVVRPVVRGDLPAVARLAAQLVRYHHDLDARRYLLVDGVEQGYARFFAGEIAREGAVVLCAVRTVDDAIVGYAYGTMEPRDWNALLDRHGALHDVLVDAAVRRAGLGRRLVLETCKRLEALGAPRVVLHTAVQNREAQALFASLGFRSTMIEMTREAGGA
jgi:ribosomal protein S18 acetylase RimI-like enzyme